MKSFWALPAFLRLVLTSPNSFSVFDDLLAFPQYEVVFPDSFVTEEFASSRLAYAASRAAPSAASDSQETQELSTPGQRPTGNAHTDGSHELEDLEETYEAVVIHGQRYLCSIPIVEPPEQNSTATPEQAKEEEEKELVRATDRGWELLEGMQGNCIYFLSPRAWWSYSFCYKEDVKQFHALPPGRGVPAYPPVEDTDVKSFILGRYPGAKGKRRGSKREVDEHPSEKRNSRKTLDAEPDDGKKTLEAAKLETKGSTRYMVQKISGGTECDLTGKDREIEVQFHCHPQSADRIGMIKEVATCSYLMVIYTPRLCNDVAFLPPQENRPNAITCQPVIASEEVDTWTSITAQIHDAEELMALAAQQAAKDPDTPRPRPTIGGIEVGGHREVGSEGKVIEKSVVVGGGKETYLGTVASSDGKTMNEKELKLLDINNPKDVEKLKKDLQKLAGRQGWRLELVNTPRGREFRGIIEAVDEGDNSPPSKESNKGRQQGDEAGGEETKEEESAGSEEIYKDEL